MSQPDNNDQKLIPEMDTNKGMVQQLREYLLVNPLDNLPSLFLLSVAAFGLLTLISSLLTSLLTFPFVLVATFACLFAAWHIRILGSNRTSYRTK